MVQADLASAAAFEKPSVVKSIQACSTMQRMSVPDTRRVM